MPKRKDGEAEVEIDEDIVNVDFDFFDIVEDDFLSVKSLIRQLLGIDSVQFNLSELTQAVVDAKVGTTIKADDEEYNDALAVMAIADFDVNKGETANLLEYWIERASENPALTRALRKIKGAVPSRVGLLVSERFLNMPFEVVPPLYSVLADEFEAKGLQYDWLLIPSRVYSERQSELDGPSEPKSKKGVGADLREFYPFHVEDPVVNDEAVASGHFAFKTPIEDTDSRRTFQEYGIHPYGHLAVLDASRLKDVAGKISQINS